MANLNLGQDVANEREIIKTAAHTVARSVKAVKCVVTVLLLTSTPLRTRNQASYLNFAEYQMMKKNLYIRSRHFLK